MCIQSFLNVVPVLRYLDLFENSIEVGNLLDQRAMKRTIRLGFIVPSSNAIVEPITTAILSSIADPTLEITAHYTRVRVEKIDLSHDANSQFSTQNMVAAGAEIGATFSHFALLFGVWAGYRISAARLVERQLACRCQAH